MKAHLIEKIRHFCGYKFPRLGKANSIFFKIAPSVVNSELFPGIHLKLNLRDLTQRATYWQGSRFEYPTPQFLASWGKENAKAFFDIGANYGFYSYWMLHSCPDILVYAFEPHPKMWELLETAKKENNLHRLKTFKIGLSESVGTLDLHLGIKDAAHSSFLQKPDLIHSEVVKVPVVPFDLWRKQIELKLPKRPEWIAKIDVEGFEINVLNGMEEALSTQSFKGISIEIREDILILGGNSSKDIFDLMKKYNYKMIEKDICKRTVNAFFVPNT